MQLAAFDLLRRDCAEFGRDCSVPHDLPINANRATQSVLLFSFDYPPNDGGIARLCAEIACGLAWRAEVRILSQRRNQEGSAVPPLYETCMTATRPWRELAAWWRLFRDHRDEVVVAGIWYPEGLLAMLAGCRRLVILAHGSELIPPRQAWRRALWARLQRFVLTQADLVIANSTYTAQLVASSVSGSRVRAIPLAVDHGRFSPGDRAAARQKFGIADPDQHVLCSVSRLCAYKGHSTVFRALTSLAPAVRQRFVYLIAGRGPDRDTLQREAADLGVSDLIRWLGYVPEDKLPDLYRASDLFVLCTRENESTQEVEGFGLVFLEAQACGTPVVGTRTGGIPDAIHEGEGGWLIPADDAPALAGIFESLVTAPDIFRAAGAAGRARVERSCTWDHYLHQFTAALTDGDSFMTNAASLAPAIAHGVTTLSGVTVVVPTLNRGGFLRDCLTDLLAQDHRPLEILVVDQSPIASLEVDDLAARHPGIVSYHRVGFRGLPQARNYGWQHARYDVILYVDDDIRCGPDLVTNHLRVLAREGVGLVGGGIDEVNRPTDVAPAPGRYHCWSASLTCGFASTGEFEVDHARGCNFSVRRSALTEAGGVDEALAIGAALYEETELALRIANRGYRVMFAGSARLRHLGAPGGGCRTDQVREYIFGLAHNRAVLIRRHGRFYHTPVAIAHLAATGVAFVWHYRSPGCLGACVRGFLQGWRAGGRPAIRTVYGAAAGGRG